VTVANDLTRDSINVRLVIRYRRDLTAWRETALPVAVTLEPGS
jgi:hypothetical protein